MGTPSAPTSGAAEALGPRGRRAHKRLPRLGNNHHTADAESEAHERRRISARMVYRVVRAEGEGELERPVASLAWSALAAGPAVSTSLLAQGLLHYHLPDTSYRMALEAFGYCIGFLIVILGRLQLFTENTITAVLPLFANFNTHTALRTARLWIIVFAANLAGAFCAVACAVFFQTVPEPFLEALIVVSERFAAKSPSQAFTHGIPAGFLIAAIVWMLPSARSSHFGVVVALTYLIALGDFAHVIVGSAEVFLLVLMGKLSFTAGVSGLILPALAGNIVGGTALFAALAYAQVRREV